MRFRMCWFFFESEGAELRGRGLLVAWGTLVLEFDNAVCGGVFYPIGEDNATVRRGVAPELSAHPRPVKDVISQNEADGLISNVLFS